MPATCRLAFRVVTISSFPLCSIWTVDLAYILRRFGLAVEFTTITLGANPDYAKESFYKEHMVEDGSRVERLFQVRAPPLAELRAQPGCNCFACDVADGCS